MKITAEVRKQLESDIAQLEHDIEGIDVSISSLRARRDGFVFKRDLFIEQLKKYGHDSSDSAKPDGKSTGGDELPLFVASRSLHNAGLREAVRSVLSSSKRPLPISEIAENLLGRDFQYSAATPLKTRLSNELSRMARTGHVLKSSHRGKLHFTLESGADE